MRQTAINPLNLHWRSLTVNRREFLVSAAAMAISPAYRDLAQQPARFNGFPAPVLLPDSYVEQTPIADYHWASSSAYEAFKDMKFGIRIHWGIYSIWHRGAESWPYLPMSFEDRQNYNNLYKTWNPAGFDATAWMDDFKQSGLKFFTFTSKHHEGFCMFDTKTRVRNRVNYIAAGGPKLESCDLAYSIMETPFRRDIVKELCDAAHRQDIKIDLYFSHPDWYDADFRPYVTHPLQIPSSRQWQTQNDFNFTQKRLGDHAIMVPDPKKVEEKRLVERHRAQLLELLTNYGKIDMLCLDMWLGPRIWPEMRKTLLMMRELQPDVMLRNRGIGNYGDYYTPERVVPGTTANSDKPWFTIYPLGTDFSYDPDAANYKGTKWIVHNLADCVAKGGGFEIGVGPSAHGEFHPEAIRQMKGAGAWLKINGEAIYGTRPRAGTLWSEGETIRYTRSKDGRFVYAILTEWPGRQVTLKSVRPIVHTDVTLLGTNQKLPWSVDAVQGTTIALSENLQQPSNRPCEHAWVLRFEAM
jgi:alpha-L-fucosidase